MKTILLTTDFSPGGMNAFAYACQLAGHARARLVLLYTFLPASPHPYIGPEMQQALHRHEEGDATDLFQSLQARVPLETLQRIDLELIQEESSPVQAALKWNHRLQPDLIIVGTRGFNPSNRKLMGKTAFSILEQAPAPVLAVPPQAHFRPPKDILVISDTNPGEQVDLHQLEVFNRLFHAEMHCLHFKLQGGAQSSRRTASLNHQYQTALKEQVTEWVDTAYQGPQSKVDNFVRTHSIDMLAISSYRQDLIRKLYETRSEPAGSWLYPQLPLLVFHR